MKIAEFKKLRKIKGKSKDAGNKYTNSLKGYNE